MKIIHVARNCTLLGGQSRIAWELGREASREGHEVHYVARRFPPGEGGGAQSFPSTFHKVFQWPKFFGRWRARGFARMASSLGERIAGKEGVIHGYGDSYRQDIITLGNVDWNYAKLIPGRIPDETALHIKKVSFLDESLSFLVLVSKQMKDALADLYPDYDQAKIRIIYPGVDISRFSPSRRDDVRARLSKDHGIPGEKVWIVSGAGGDFVKRNFATLGKALARIAHRKEWVFVLVGAGKGEVSLPREVEERTYSLGRLSDISAVLPGCDLMPYPAWYDESPLFCLESMASGLPMILSKTVGTGEVMSEENRRVGLLNDPADDASLASKIEAFIADASLRGRISRDNAKAAESFSWPATYARYKALYEEVSARKLKTG